MGHGATGTVRSLSGQLLIFRADDGALLQGMRGRAEEACVKFHAPCPMPYALCPIPNSSLL